MPHVNNDGHSGGSTIMFVSAFCKAYNTGVSSLESCLKKVWECMGSYGNLYRMNSVDDKGQDWLSNMGLFHWSNSLST